MDDQQLAIFSPAPYNTHMAVITIKDQVTRLGIRPGNRCAITVLGCCAATVDCGWSDG